jgi:probable rRNA maturation factor
MILIDPELELFQAAHALNAGSAKRSVGPAASADRKLPAKPRPLPSGQSPARAPARAMARTLTQFLKRAQAAVGLDGQVTVLLTGDAAMRDLNRRFRGKNKATDVLSFPASNLVQNQGKSQEKGDVAISVETAQRQSVEQGHPLATEIKVLMLHGLLHLAGYDHETDAGEMRRREQRLRAGLGLPTGLIERSISPTLSQNTRKDGARGRKATTGPSTSAAKTASAQDDKTKRASKPKKKSLRSARSARP